MMHSLMRKSTRKYVLGYENNSLIIYSRVNDFNDLLNSDKLKNLYKGQAFFYEESDVGDKEPFLKRVNNIQQISKKVKEKKAYYKKMGLSDTVIDKEIIKYKDGLKQKEKNSIYFIAKKNNVKIMIFGEIDYGDIFSLETNSYGLSRRML